MAALQSADWGARDEGYRGGIRPTPGQMAYDTPGGSSPTLPPHSSTAVSARHGGVYERAWQLTVPTALQACEPTIADAGTLDC